jgi:rhamnosyltransferase
MTPSLQRPTVLAIAVTYLPEAEPLRALLESLLSQVQQILIVDNTPSEDDRVFQVVTEFPQYSSAELRLVRLGRNVGIAGALNVGIEIALAEGYDFVLLSDQDSLPQSDMVQELLSVAQQLESAGAPLACVSPVYIDRITGQVFGFQAQERGRLFYSTLGGDQADPWIEVVTAITSGALIPRGALIEIGPMREDYFIDYVDTEWCHRARSRGYKLYGTSRARMEHHLGAHTFRVWYLRWRPFTGYPPRRLYYRFRNFVLLMRCSYVPLRWKLRASWYWLGNAYAYLLFSPDRRENMRFIAKGLMDGLRGRSGMLDPQDRVR